MTFTYQWLRCGSSSCSAISGATGSTYVLGSADVNKKIEVQVTAQNNAGSATATSAKSGSVSS
jgi:hypothetical protein